MAKSELMDEKRSILDCFYFSKSENKNIEENWQLGVVCANTL
jgi:hypothetical protein